LIVKALLLWMLLGSAFLAILYRRPLIALWREPVLRNPVLIVESDDWGPGPAHHADALERLSACLAKHRDCTGHPAVMTLGVTLSVPDAITISRCNASDYAALWLDAEPFAAHLKAMLAGRDRNVFAPQLHGAAHYWPPALMHAAAEHEEVCTWLTTPASLETESLPSALQSRWTDASRLPSVSLSEGATRLAVSEEAEAYVRILGEPPRVAVPPTFIWNRTVERAWAEAGIHCVITPGRRYEARNEAGDLIGPNMPIRNGERGEGGMIYLVRDAYFEPAYGHRAERALAALATKLTQGRPCLLETHRFNFTGRQADAAVAEVDRLLTQALARFPDLRFSSCAELAEQFRHGGDWLEQGFARRYSAWFARLRALSRFWKLARLSGLAYMLSAVAIISNTSTRA